MTDPARAVRPIQAWLWGGVLLIVAVILQALWVTSLPYMFLWSQIVAPFLLLIALLVFALPSRSSVVRGSRLGLIAVIVFGVLQFLALPLLVGFAFGDLTVGLTTFYISWGVLLVSGIVAGIAIGRAGAVPTPWSWLPLVGLLIVFVPSALNTVLNTVDSGNLDPSPAREAVSAIAGGAGLVVVGVLGVLAIVLAFTTRLPARVEAEPTVISA